MYYLFSTNILARFELIRRLKMTRLSPKLNSTDFLHFVYDFVA
jgi:hypothetical protein